MTEGNATCETCPYWQEIKPPLDTRIRVGHCHHVANEYTPLDHNWWCSEHPDRQRDRLAAMAMRGLAVRDRLDGGVPSGRSISAFAYEIADAMLAERKKGA